MNTKTFQPQIFLTCLEDGKNAEKYGRWINANQSPEKLSQAIDDFLRRRSSLIRHKKRWQVSDMKNFGFYFQMRRNFIEYYPERNNPKKEFQYSREKYLKEVSLVARFLLTHGKTGDQAIEKTFFSREISLLDLSKVLEGHQHSPNEVSFHLPLDRQLVEMSKIIAREERQREAKERAEWNAHWAESDHRHEECMREWHNRTRGLKGFIEEWKSYRQKKAEVRKTLNQGRA